MAELFNCTVNDLLGYRYFRRVQNGLARSIPQAKIRIAKSMWNKIDDSLASKHINHIQLAERIGVSFKTLETWFKMPNEKYPKTIVFLRICDALDCTPSDLLGY